MSDNDVLLADLQQLNQGLNALGVLPHGPMIYDYFFQYSNLIAPFYAKHYTTIKSKKDKRMKLLAQNLYAFVKNGNVTPKTDDKQVIHRIGPKPLSFYMNNPELSPRAEGELYALTNPYVILHLIAEILANAQKRALTSNQHAK